MPGVLMKSSVEAEFQRQMNYELGAAHAYTALAIWCFDKNLKGFSSFFYKQAEEEREHAQKFIDFILDRGAFPRLRELPAPKVEFGSLLEVAQQAQVMEQSNSQGVIRAYEIAMKEGDYPGQVMLHWFISEQVEEEAWTDEMVARVESANCAGGLAELDRHINRYMTSGEKD